MKYLDFEYFTRKRSWQKIGRNLRKLVLILFKYDILTKYIFNRIVLLNVECLEEFTGNLRTKKIM